MLSAEQGGTWLVWDNAARAFVAGPFTNHVRASAEVRARNAQAGFGRVANRPRQRPPAVAAAPSEPEPPEPAGRAIILQFVRATPGAGFGRSAAVAVRRPKRKGQIPPAGKKVTIAALASVVGDAVVMSAAPGALGEVVLLLEGIDATEIPPGAEITWWA